MTVSVALTDSLRAYVEARVTEDGYSSAEEYLRDLIRRDRERQELRRLVLGGLASGAGEVVDDAWFEGLRAETRTSGAAGQG